MTIETKYSPGDKAYVIVRPSMRGGGHGWICQPVTIYHLEIFCNSHKEIDIEYTFKESVDSKYEPNIYTTREECEQKIEEIISKIK